jgi:hypothetical protein
MSRGIHLALAVIGTLSFLAQPGNAQEKPSLHQSWPIQNEFNRQPTRNELRALHEQDLPPSDARELDRLYDEFMTNGAGGTHRIIDGRTR